MTQPISFDRAVDYYDRTRGFPPGEERAVAAIIATAGGLTASSCVLEIGVGTGRIALPLARHVGFYVGIDIATAMMDRLRAKQTDEPVELAQASALRLPFAAASFDAVVAVHVFHLIADWPDALAECARVLKPGGALLHCWNDRSASAIGVLYDAWRQAVPEFHEQRPGIAFEDNDVFALTQGWRAAPARIYTYPVMHTPAEFLQGHRERHFSGSWNLDDATVARGVAAIEAAIAEHFPDPTMPLESQSRFVVRPFLPPDGATGR